MCLYNLTQKINHLVEEYIEENMQETTPASLGIDIRACRQVWTGSEGIAIKQGQRRTFDYYAGGEYVDKESVHVAGDWVFYDNGDSRVAEWLDRLEEGEDGEDIDNPNWVGSRHHY